MLAALRPGGGGSFRGGSSSGSSRGGSFSGGSSRSGTFGSSSSGNRSSGNYDDRSGSGDIGLIGFLLSTTIGGIGFIVFVVFLIGLALVMKRQGMQLAWNAGADEPPLRERIRPLLERIRQHDANFSLVLLEDFLYALYAQAHTLRGGAALERLSAYLKPEARAALAALGDVREVRSIIIGAMRYVGVEGAAEGAPTVRLQVEFETNYSELGPSGAERSFYAREAWVLARNKGVLSRPPDRVRVFTCPSCGAPVEGVAGGRCQYWSSRRSKLLRARPAAPS